MTFKTSDLSQDELGTLIEYFHESWSFEFADEGFACTIAGDIESIERVKEQYRQDKQFMLACKIHAIDPEEWLAEAAENMIDVISSIKEYKNVP